MDNKNSEYSEYFEEKIAVIVISSLISRIFFSQMRIITSYFPVVLYGGELLPVGIFTFVI